MTVWSGITAKELSVQMLEGDGSEPAVVMQLNHVGYLGRELARAEQCLRSGAQYVQDCRSCSQSPAGRWSPES